MEKAKSVAALVRDILLSVVLLGVIVVGYGFARGAAKADDPVRPAYCDTAGDARNTMPICKETEK